MTGTDDDKETRAVGTGDTGDAGVTQLPPANPPRYVDEGQVGQGGMSIVHRVRDTTLLRAVALKRLRDRYVARPAEVDRFLEEAQITGQLDHPNVVPVHELSIDETGRPYFVMKLVEGQTLGDILSKTALPREGEALAELLGVLVKVCDAVAFAHSKGIIHRDIKPQNVMVGAYGEVYLNDWGLARLTAAPPAQDGENDDGSGTVWYMAPEQAVPGPAGITPLTDVFALGGLLYEILTGRPPHDGATPNEVRARAFLCEVDPPDLVLGAGVVPPALSRIAMKAMSRDPEKRHPGALALRRELDRALRGGEQFTSKVFAPGQLVVAENEPGDVAYVITEGRCRAFKTVDGRMIHLREMGPGDVFGETAIFTGKPRTASVEAIDRLVVREVSRAALDEGLGMNGWMGTFVRALADRFRELDAKLTALGSPASER